MMKDELYDLVDKLLGYSEDGWRIVGAEKNSDGSWNLKVTKIVKKEKPAEATDESNK